MPKCTALLVLTAVLVDPAVTVHTMSGSLMTAEAQVQTHTATNLLMHLHGSIAGLTDAMLRDIVGEGVEVIPSKELEHEVRSRFLDEALRLHDEDDVEGAALLGEYAVRAPPAILLVPVVSGANGFLPEDLGERSILMDAESQKPSGAERPSAQQSKTATLNQTAAATETTQQSRKAVVERAVQEMIHRMQAMEEGAGVEEVMRAVEEMSESSEMYSKEGQTLMRTRRCNHGECSRTVQRCKDGIFAVVEESDGAARIGEHVERSAHKG